jgi:hypothetical protein
MGIFHVYTHIYIYANDIYIYVYIIYDMHTIYTCTYHLCISYDVNNKYVYITVHIYIYTYIDMVQSVDKQWD